MTVSLSLCVEFRDSQAKGPVIFREGGGGATIGAGDGVVLVGFGLVFGGESGLGDHGIAGNEAAILLRESFFEGCFSGTGGGGSSSESPLVDVVKISIYQSIDEPFDFSTGRSTTPSSRTTLSRDAFELRLDGGVGFAVVVLSSSIPFSLLSTPFSFVSMGWPFGFSSFVAFSADSKSPSVAPLLGRGESLRFVRDLTDPVSTASSKVSFKRLRVSICRSYKAVLCDWTYA